MIVLTLFNLFYPQKCGKAIAALYQNKEKQSLTNESVDRVVPHVYTISAIFF